MTILNGNNPLDRDYFKYKHRDRPKKEEKEEGGRRRSRDDWVRQRYKGSDFK